MRQRPWLHAGLWCATRLDALQVGLPIHCSPLHWASLTERLVTRAAAHGGLPPVTQLISNHHLRHNQLCLFGIVVVGCPWTKPCESATVSEMFESAAGVTQRTHGRGLSGRCASRSWPRLLCASRTKPVGSRAAMVRISWFRGLWSGGQARRRRGWWRVRAVTGAKAGLVGQGWWRRLVHQSTHRRRSAEKGNFGSKGHRNFLYRPKSGDACNAGETYRCPLHCSVDSGHECCSMNGRLDHTGGPALIN